VLIANIGIPMVFVTVPTMLLALVPVALVEGCVLCRICSLPAREACRGALRANLLSTLLGIPIAWFVLAVLQMVSGGGVAWGLETPLDRFAAVTLQAAWLVPYGEDLRWMVPAASLTLLIPFYVASVVVELAILKKRWPDSLDHLRIGVIYANLLSYFLLGGFYAIGLIRAWD
jgi:hypothetical protein